MNERPFDCGEQGRRNRAYRRFQKKKHMDRLLYWIGHLPYFACSPYLSDHFQGKSLWHSGVYIKYPSSNRGQSYLKRKASRASRRFHGMPAKGNHYRKVFDYRWAIS